MRSAALGAAGLEKKAFGNPHAPRDERCPCGESRFTSKKRLGGRGPRNAGSADKVQVREGFIADGQTCNGSRGLFAIGEGDCAIAAWPTWQIWQLSSRFVVLPVTDHMRREQRERQNHADASSR